MAYVIQVSSFTKGQLNKEVAQLQRIVSRCLAAQKLDCELSVTVKLENSPRGQIELSRVRKKAPHAYCGNHPGPCPVGSRKTFRKELEALDWIRFNNRLNKALDKVQVGPRVHITSNGGKLVVRHKGQGRRIWAYKMTSPRHAEWLKGEEHMFDPGCEYQDYDTEY
jgi:hypothetical protein